jgi:thymidylate synthase (FAD)
MEHENHVEIIGHYGGDISHALSAWTSTSRDLPDEKRARMGKLLTSLARDGHHTPFEKSTLHFLCTTDIATHIHIIKHRIGVAVNGESARYKELKDDKFYVPFDWDAEERRKHVEFCEYALKEYHECLERLVSKGYSRKRAKESARMKLPYSNQIVCDVSFNWRSFMHFVKLRYSDHAQYEVRDLAYSMLVLAKNIEGHPFKLSMEAFGLLDEEGDLVPAFK